MNWKRTATLGVIGGTLATLLARASTSVVAPPTNVSAQLPLNHRTQLLTPEVARLHERLNAPTAPAVPARNLFRFRSLDRPSSLPLAHRESAMALPTSAPVPSLTLVGLAADSGTSGVVRTAIISGIGGLHFAHVGDTIVPGYRVTDISDDSVVVSAPAGAAPLLLRLK